MYYLRFDAFAGQHPSHRLCQLSDFNSIWSSFGHTLGGTDSLDSSYPSRLPHPNLQNAWWALPHHAILPPWVLTSIQCKLQRGRNSTNFAILSRHFCEEIAPGLICDPTTLQPIYSALLPKKPMVKTFCNPHLQADIIGVWPALICVYICICKSMLALSSTLALASRSI